MQPRGSKHGKGHMLERHVPTIRRALASSRLEGEGGALTMEGLIGTDKEGAGV